MLRGVESQEYVICPVAMVRETKYRSYPHRWYLLTVTCLLALSNAAIWISFAAVTTNVNTFYCREDETDCPVAYWTNQIFQIVGCVGGIFGIFITDKYGIVVSTYCGSCFNFIGILLRTLSSLPSMSYSARIWMLFVGQTLCASSQPFFLVLSPKVAEYWFSDRQRALANALSFAANPMGVVLGTVAPELIIRDITTRNDRDLFYLNSLLLSLATVVMLLTFGVCNDKPPTPPSASSASNNSPPFLQGLMSLFCIPVFYIQMMSFGMAFALQWSLFISIEPMMTALGYNFIGYASALSAIAGFVSSIVAGCYVDKSKRFTEVIKGSSIGIAVMACAINGFVRHRNGGLLDSFILAFLLMLLGFFSIPSFPIGLELGLETTFPIAEASSSGVLIIAGQLLLFLMSAIMNGLPKMDWLYKSQRTPGHDHDALLLDANYQLSIDAWTGIAFLSMIFTCFALWPRYKRLEYERNALSDSDEPQTATVTEA